MEFVEFEDVVESWYSTTTSQVCSVASGANDTRRLASDFLRASLLDSNSFSSSFLSLSSRSLAAACCSSSVRKVTRVSFTAALPSTWNGLGRLSAPVTVGPDGASMLKSMSISDAVALGGVDFFGLAFLADICAGISRRGGIVGFRIDFGGG